MFMHYLALGVRNLRRNPALTLLMVVTLAVGVAASVSTLTILHVMGGNPIPHKSSRLLVPLVDPGQMSDYTPGDEPNDNQITYRDATAFLASGQGERRVAIFGFTAAVQPPRADLPLATVSGLAATRDFFEMFEVPFAHGGAWSAQADEAGADVIVLNGAQAEKLFGSTNPLGQRVRLLEHDFQVVGVIGNWRPLPKYYRLINGTGGAFGDEEQFLVPLRSAVRHQQRNSGNTSCSGSFPPGYQGFLDSECTWVQFWFETGMGQGRAKLMDYLQAYVAEQRKLGRLLRPGAPLLFDVTEWLEHLRIIGNDRKLAAWLALGFLLLCLVNTVGLLLAKFSARASEVGIRRALGASRAEIFWQFLTETSVIGLVGGVLGLALSFAGLWLIALQSNEMAVVARMDWVMLGVTFLLSVSASMLAGLFPTWRACQVTPALQLKSQ